jgi:hypothetical protein
MLMAWFGLSVAQAQAQPVELYRFENEDGVVVLSHTIPPELVHKGYSVVGEDGTVVRVVARELTRAEVVQRELKLAAEKAAEDAGVARARHDEELMKLYSSARDVEEARDRKLLSIETVVATTKANLERLRLQKQRLEQQAADREREGLPLSTEILDNLAILEAQIGEKDREVVARKLEQQLVVDQFALDLERVNLLYGVAPVQTAVTTEPAR